METKSQKTRNTKLCRWLRAGIGIAMIVAGIALEETIGIVLIVLGALALISGIVWACPCSTIFGADKAEKTCCLSRSKNKNGGCLHAAQGKGCCS